MTYFKFKNNCYSKAIASSLLASFRKLATTKIELHGIKDKIDESSQIHQQIAEIISTAVGRPILKKAAGIVQKYTNSFFIENNKFT